MKKRQVKQNLQEWFDEKIANEIKNHNRFKKIKKSKLHIDKDIYVARYKLQKMIVNKKKHFVKTNNWIYWQTYGRQIYGKLFLSKHTVNQLCHISPIEIFWLI